MKKILATLLLLTLYSCSTLPINNEVQPTIFPCQGNSDLPVNLATQFDPIKDAQLLKEALGPPNKGKLCQGKVYISKAGTQTTLFRAWNSTNPNSKFGKWWAFQKPSGKVSTYRSEYEICYQWSPLDKLVSCTLKPEIKVVIGTGQSAKCSEYLTYPVSEKQQIYIDNATTSLTECTIYDGEFSWKKL